MSVPDQVEPPRPGGGQRGLFAAVQDEISQVVAHELRYLERRTSLTAAERVEVALVLHRLTVRLTLPAVASRGRAAHAGSDRPESLDRGRRKVA